MSFWKGVAINVASFFVVVLICLSLYHWYNYRSQATMKQVEDDMRNYRSRVSSPTPTPEPIPDRPWIPK